MIVTCGGVQAKPEDDLYVGKALTTSVVALALPATVGALSRQDSPAMGTAATRSTMTGPAMCRLRANIGADMPALLLRVANVRNVDRVLQHHDALAPPAVFVAAKTRGCG